MHLDASVSLSFNGECEAAFKVYERLLGAKAEFAARRSDALRGVGQRKRIGIARTLILKPQIMLYDEPTAGLDPTTSLEICDLIKEVREKYHTSSIVITHDLTCARNTGDRIAMLLDGRFLTQGSFEEVFASDDENIKSFYNYNFIQ